MLNDEITKNNKNKETQKITQVNKTNSWPEW